MRYFFVYLILTIFQLNCLAQDSNCESKLYYYIFNINKKNMWPETFYGISDKNIPVPLYGHDITSYIDGIYGLVDCCYDVCWGVTQKLDSITTKKKIWTFLFENSKKFTESKTTRFKLQDGTVVYVEKYCIIASCRLANEDENLKSTAYPLWYYKSHRLPWYVVYNLQQVYPCDMSKGKWGF